MVLNTCEQTEDNIQEPGGNKPFRSGSFACILGMIKAEHPGKFSIFKLKIHVFNLNIHVFNLKIENLPDDFQLLPKADRRTRQVISLCEILLENKKVRV